MLFHTSLIQNVYNFTLLIVYHIQGMCCYQCSYVCLWMLRLYQLAKNNKQECIIKLCVYNWFQKYVWYGIALGIYTIFFAMKHIYLLFSS